MIKQSEMIMSLYRLAMSNAPVEQVIDWASSTTTPLSVTAVKRTLVQAGREDLMEYLIEETDVHINDKVKSRYTARVGKVVGVHTDGDTIDVKWAAGGIQAVPKESLYRVKNEEDPNSYEKYSTGADVDVYASMKKHDIYVRDNPDETGYHSRDSKHLNTYK